MAHATAEERWLPIPGYEGFYEVSGHGRVRSLNRTILRSDGVWQPCRGRVLRPGGSNGPGHLFVNLCGMDKRHRVHWVHRLVLQAFVGPCPTGKMCCHWDDGPKNNRLSNLRWDTRSKNVHDAVRNGRNFRAARTHCPRNHPFRSPNLIITYEPKCRRCLACVRAGRLVKARVKAGLVEAARVDMQALSDLLYAEVIATGGAPRPYLRGRLSYPEVLPVLP